MTEHDDDDRRRPLAVRPATLEDFAQQIADQVESFLVALQAIARGEATAAAAISLLLLEVSQVLLAGARLGAQRGLHARAGVPARRRSRPGPRRDAAAAGRMLDERGHLRLQLRPLRDPEMVASPALRRPHRIATDVANGLRHFRAGNVSEALWWWQFSYVASWGNNASAVLRALQSIVAHDRLDAEFAGEEDQVAAANEMLDEPGGLDPPVESGVVAGAVRPAVPVRTSEEVAVGIVVQKYGGSSVADADGIKRVAQRIVESQARRARRRRGRLRDGRHHRRAARPRQAGQPRCRRPASSTCCSPPASGSRWRCSRWRSPTSAHEARSFTGSPGRRDHRLARTAGPGSSTSPRAGSCRRSTTGAIAIVAGFQGVSQDTKDITTLGRGGSDTTAVALAAALRADVCEIYTDVDGVFTADPRIVPTARKLDRISYEEMLELAACGAKVLHLRCVEYARRYDMPDPRPRRRSAS